MIEAEVRPDLAPYYKEDLAPRNLAPLWEVLHKMVQQEPKSPCEPAI